MKCVHWKLESGYGSLAIKCCGFLCVCAVITIPLFSEVMEYCYGTQQVRPQSWQIFPTVLAKDVSSHDLSFFQSIVAFKELPLIPPVSSNITDLFQKALSEQDLELLSGAMQTFDMVMKNASIPYFIFEGSLLGSYRHHNIVPWDDDVDLILHQKHKLDLVRMFEGVKSRYGLDTSTFRYKFYDTSGHSPESKPWKTPFLDIAFYEENATHVWDNYYSRLLVYNKSDVFPLADRPFLGRMYPAPRDPLRILHVNYNLDLCSTGWYNHTAEKRKDSSLVKTVPCSSLLGVVPFVQHVRGPGGAWCEEVLTFRGQVQSTFVRNSTNIPVC